MSYQVLARKWRPQQFKDLLGQEHVVKALGNALDNNRLHHAYLLTGIRGVGKTTIARIFAKSLNCEKGVSSEPCGSCTVCQDIEAGRFFDLIEVDAASKTGVDDARELIESAAYAPTSGRYKVYLIDEVHMFSNNAFNALLKTLEEPPEHAKFILATTEPQKIPVTVLSRCLQFSLKGMAEGKLATYLERILDEEKIEFEATALSHIAHAAEGSVRDSLSLLEQATAMGAGSIRADIVEGMLGRVSPERVLDVLAAVASGDAPQTMQTVETLSEYGPDYRQLLGEMISVLHHIAMAKAVPGAERFVASLDLQRVQALAAAIGEEDVQLYHQIAVHGRRDMPHAPDAREAFEMTLLRMLTFKLDVAGKQHNEPDPVAPSSPAPSEPKASADPVPQSQPPADSSAAVPAVTAGVSPQPESQDVSPLLDDVVWDVSNWQAITKRLGLKAMTGQLAGNCAFKTLTNDEIVLQTSHDSAYLNTPRDSSRLQQAISKALGREITLTIEVGDVDSETPAQGDVRMAEEKQLQAEQAIESDPVVQNLLQKVDGVVDPASVQPLDAES